MINVQLSERLKALKINQNDIIETFVCSSGPGGQNVNKVATCVVLRHIPTGVSVKCQTKRTQHQNRLLAWKMLIDKIELQKNNEIKRQQSIKEKERRLNRRKPGSLKEQILRKKKINSEKKKERRKVFIHQLD